MALPQPPAAQDRTEQIRNILQAQQGKVQAAPTGQPQRTARAEQIAQMQIGQQAQQLEQAGAQQREQQQLQAREQKQRIEQNKVELEEKRLDQRIQFNQRSEDILRDLKQKERELDFKRDGAKVEQLGFNIRLNNEQYINKLQTEARRARIYDDFQFREELQRAIFAEERDLFNNDLQFRRMIDANEREFKQQLENIDIEQAIQIANIEAQQANQEMIWSGVGDLVSGAAKAYAAYEGEGEEDDSPTGNLAMNTRTPDPTRFDV